MPRRPNILLITSDQQRWDHIGALGMKGLPTPALDQLATEGAHFTRAYCPTPLCTPTRLSLLTGLLTAYEDAQRVPLLIWAPGRRWRAGHSDALVSLIDLPRLFLHLAGLPTPQGVQGADLLPHLAEGAAPAREGVTIEAHLTAKLHQLTYVDRKHKIVIYRDQPEWGELYDLAADPDQYVNLWARDVPLRARLLAALARQRLREEGHAHPRASFG